MKNKTIYMVSIFIGIFISLSIWIFITIMELATNFIWEYIPSKMVIPFYTLIICLIGGLLIGLLHKKYGDYPEELEEVIKKIKQDKKYNYNNLPIIFVSALLPLIFGAAVGPEAGLTGFIVGIFCWASEKIKYLHKNIKEISEIGFSATLSIIFATPLFGITLSNEDITKDEEKKLPKKSVFFSYILASASGLLFMMFLNNLFGGGLSLPSFNGNAITNNDRVISILLILIGFIAGIIYHISNKISVKIFNKLKRKPVTSALIGSFILGVTGMILPLTMFSGENDSTLLVNNYKQIGFTMLLLIGIIKMILTNICINSGLRGGHFFPLIFAGISIGLACSLILPVGDIFSISVVTAALLSTVIKKPLAVVMLLLLCFPGEYILWICLAAYLVNVFSVDRLMLKSDQNLK